MNRSKMEMQKFNKSHESLHHIGRVRRTKTIRPIEIVPIWTNISRFVLYFHFFFILRSFFYAIFFALLKFNGDFYLLLVCHISDGLLWVRYRALHEMRFESVALYLFQCSAHQCFASTKINDAAKRKCSHSQSTGTSPYRRWIDSSVIICYTISCCNRTNLVLLFFLVVVVVLVSHFHYVFGSCLSLTFNAANDCCNSLVCIFWQNILINRQFAMWLYRCCAFSCFIVSLSAIRNTFPILKRE